MKTIQQNPASDNQKADIAAFIAGLTFRIIKTKIQAEAILSNKGDLARKLKSLLGEITFESEYITNYKRDLEKFFLEIYEIKLDLSDMNFVESETHKHYMVVPFKLDADKIFKGFDKIGLQKYRYISADITSFKKAEQSRPKWLYGFAHLGGAESDRYHLGKSYNEFIVQHTNFLTIDEYLLIHQFMWWKFKTHLDVGGWTITATLDRDSSVMHSCWYNNECRLTSVGRYAKNPDQGPRSAILF